MQNLYKTKDKFEYLIAQLIPENEFGISRVSFTGDCIEVEYAIFADNRIQLKTMVIDRNII